MKKFLSFSLILIFLSTFLSCQNNSTGSGNDVEEAPPERQFIWNAMNYWYFWQEDIPKLADDMQFFDNKQAYHDYLMEFQDVEGVFNDLLFSEDNFDETIAEDDFSFFIDDYEEFNQQRQGNSFDFGFQYGLVRMCKTCTDLFGYVQYVLDNTPADEAGLQRGDVFTHINGTRLTVNNYTSALSTNRYELGLADYNDEDVTPNGETVTVEAADVTEDPIFLSKVIDTGSAKVGYLMYNSFQSNSHENLNKVFEDFDSQTIDELVLDLRYNGGGSVITSQVLASMISGLGDDDDFGRFSFNSKRAPQYDQPLSFRSKVPLYDDEGNPTDQTIPMNTVQLNQLYVLTGFGTASASEAIINSLKPYMDVIVIGRQTVGKDDVSLTLYDSGGNYLSRENINPDHEYAIQPIVAKIVNKNGESNHEGFLPTGDHFIREIDYLDDLPPLGDENEQLLARALAEITGGPVAKLAVEATDFEGRMFKDSRDLRKFGKEMYITPEEINQPNLNFGPESK